MIKSIIYVYQGYLTKNENNRVKIMDKLISLNPGLLIWTIFNFLIFLFLILKFGLKPMMTALKAREDSIANNLKAAQEANEKTQAILNESQAKLQEAAKEVNALINKGREQANEIINNAKLEAEKLRQEKLENAIKEIKIAQDSAFLQLKNQIAEMVIQATEKVLEEKLNEEKDIELIKKSVEKLSKN